LTWLELILLAAVQGLTEFLPISSSGHLVLAQALLGVRAPGIGLEIVLHLGSLAAVVLYYRRDLLDLAAGSARYLRGSRGVAERGAFRLVSLLALATAPLVVAGLLLGGAVESAFEDPRLVCAALLVTGLLLLSTRLARRGDRPPGPAGALLVGALQAAALLPGISRSGSTIAGGLFAGLAPAEAARFAFLLSIPAITGAGVYGIRDLADGFAGSGLGSYSAGFLVSLATSYVAIDVLLRVVRRGRLAWFGLYCLGLGAAGLVFLSR